MDETSESRIKKILEEKITADRRSAEGRYQSDKYPLALREAANRWTYKIIPTIEATVSEVNSSISSSGLRLRCREVKDEDYVEEKMFRIVLESEKEKPTRYFVEFLLVKSRPFPIAIRSEDHFITLKTNIIDINEKYIQNECLQLAERYLEDKLR
jgi:hypothetical protein